MLDINKEELKKVFFAIGLANESGGNYKERLKKHKQIYDYLLHLSKAINKLSTKREIILVDCACGKSYLSFIAYYYFVHIENRNIKFVCIDYNEHVINSSKEAAEELGFTNMEFICSDIFKVKFDIKPDIIYSLHACDTATDMTIAKGLLEDAKFIFTVSCCQHTVRSTMKKHPLKSITKHGVYKERLADMIADSMRSLILESKGYKVSVFDYISSSETPKNVMVRAVKSGSKSDNIIKELNKDYNNLKTLFNVEPKLMDYING